MEKIKVQISNRQENIKILTGIRMLVRRCCTAVLKNEGTNIPIEVSVSFVDNEQIKELNSIYRKKNKDTDVLSFPLGENGEWDKNYETGLYMLGDIVISIEKAIEQADIYHHSIQREIAFLTVHSMFHLLGYDHENGGIEELNMREKEEEVLKQLDLSRERSFTIEDEK